MVRGDAGSRCSLPAGAEREGHRALDDDLAVDARDALEHAHACSQPHDLASISTTSPGWTGRRKRTRSMPAKNGSRCRFSGLARIRIAPTCATASVRIVGGSTGAPFGSCDEIALVERHVLDADDALVDFEFGDAIDEQKRIAVREDALDRRVVERQRQVHGGQGLYLQTPLASYDVNRACPQLLDTGCPRERYRVADDAVRARPRGHVGARSRRTAAEDPAADRPADQVSGVCRLPARSERRGARRSRTPSAIPTRSAQTLRVKVGEGPGRRGGGRRGSRFSSTTCTPIRGTSKRCPDRRPSWSCRCAARAG